MWVLDGVKDSLFAYVLATSGELLARVRPRLHATATPTASGPMASPCTGSPTTTRSDSSPTACQRSGEEEAGTAEAETDGRVEAAETGPEQLELERVRDEEFTELTTASNNSPRGIWSDGEVMYVADESDNRVYTYNMPARDRR